MYKFDRLIKKYSVACKLHAEAAGGIYVGGEWVPEAAPPPIDVSGVIVPMTDRKIYQSGGTYTEQDREFITHTEIPLEPTRHLVHKGEKYQVQGDTDYSDYAGFYVYNLKRIGAFDR